MPALSLSMSMIASRLSSITGFSYVILQKSSGSVDLIDHQIEEEKQ
jgi:hypothetical protein